MNKQTKIFVAVVAAAVIAVIIWAFTADTTRQRQSEAPGEETPANMSYTGNTLTEEKDGKVIWKLHADKIEIDRDTQNASMDGISGEFYQNDGSIVELKAGKAFYNVTTKEIDMQADVQAQKSDGTALSMQKLSWNNEQQSFNGEGDVRMTKENLVVTGQKVESSDGFKKIRISGNAHIVKGE